MGRIHGNVFAVDAATGEDVWTYRTGDAVVSSPAVVGGDVYVETVGGTLIAVDRESGETRCDVEFDGSIH